MIHNNFRKVVKRFMGAGVVSSTIQPLYYDFIDITGYVGNSSDTLVAYVTCATFGNSNVSNATLSSIQTGTSSTYQTLWYACIGNTAQNEPEYTLGSIIENDLTFTTSNIKSGNVVAVTTITNTGSSDIQFDEVGLFYHVYNTASATNWNGKKYMNMLLIKEVLNASRTLPAGASVSISFSLFDENN